MLAQECENRGKIRDRFRGAVKRERELQQYRSELTGLVQYIEAGAHRALVFWRGARVVGELLPKLRGKHKARIAGDAVEPLPGMLRVQWLVERSVDLDGVKEFCEVRSLVKAFRPRRRVHVSGPVRIRPSRRP